ncbi:hypothetical protein B0A58_00010 [Flavobacterium branchiophilum NBRC 15030 = ATCC 35035]|nr:hypothetical protein B0A58_00010 [Flavobacterium branchiophilum NBRC 15030 = ATCC 35035]
MEFDEFYFPKGKVLAMLRNFAHKVSNIIGTSKAPQPPKGEFKVIAFFEFTFHLTPRKIRITA